MKGERYDEYMAKCNAVIRAYAEEEDAIMKKYRDKYGPFDEQVGRMCSRELRPLEKHRNKQLNELKAEYRDVFDE
ncbi:MAG: hypothetical protein KBS68_02030 [Clostridiales bacterium]|nr:hypothetical protein [Candidatus Crickella merdequi]